MGFIFELGFASYIEPRVFEPAYERPAHAVLVSRARMYTLIEEQSTFSIYGRTRSIHRDGAQCKRCARVYTSEIAGNLRGLRVISQWLQSIVLQYYTAVVARVHGQRTLLHGVRTCACVGVCERTRGARKGKGEGPRMGELLFMLSIVGGLLCVR